MSLPAKWTDRQIRVDTFHRAVVERTVRPGGDATERDALGAERLLDPVALRFRALANARRLCLQLATHLARETGNRTQTEEMRGIALIRAAGPFTVAPEERILRLRAGSVGPALRMTAEACEGIGSPGQTAMDAMQARCVVDRLAVRRPAAPAVLGPEQVPEQLVPHDEQGIDPERATVQARLGERGVLDQLTRVARVEHPVEVLAATEVDGLLQLLAEHGVVGDRRVVRREGGAPRRFRAAGLLRLPDHQDPERYRRQEAERRDAPLPSPSRARLTAGNVGHESDT